MRASVHSGITMSFHSGERYPPILLCNMFTDPVKRSDDMVLST